MNRPPRLLNLSAERLASALRDQDGETTPEQLLAIEQFVERLGGFENARAALELLSQLERAA